MLPKEPSDQIQGSNVKSGRWKGKPCNYRSNRVIVKLKPVAEETTESIDNVCNSIAHDIPSGHVFRSPKASGRVVYSVDPSADIPNLAKQLARREDVEYAEPDVIDQPAVIPNDPRFGDQWSHAKVGSAAAWDLNVGAAKILIGIIDSGISMTGGALDHPDLGDTTRYLLGTDYVDGGTPRDLGGHGTHVTGIAAAMTNNGIGVSGMNWSSQVYICRTLGPGGGSSADFADAVEEIVDYALANDLKAVINYSAGGGPNQTKIDACKYVNDNGMILCAATGNDNGGPVIWPAAYSTDFDGVIAVGSTDEDDTVSSFSNVGPEVTVVAPGRDILSTTPTYPSGANVALNYDAFNGTSMATPLVTGLVSLMWGRHPGFTNKRIRDCLTSTSVKLGPGDFSNAWGNGRIDAEKAVRCGDVIFPPFTRFTFFTFFTRFTRFTFFTPFTRFTFFTRFTPFTRFTFFTPFTRFTRFTFFTPFTRFTPPIGRPFIRFGGTVFAPEELEIGRFSELDEVRESLQAIGIQTIDEVATSSPAAIAESICCEQEDAVQLVEMTKQILVALAQDEYKKEN